MNKRNKYNANTVYFNRELNISFPPEIGEGLPGFQRFDSEFELKVYQEILKHTFYIERQKTFNLVASKLVADFFLQYECDRGQRHPLVIEAKGYQTQIWRLKYKEFKALYPHIAVVVIRRTTGILSLSKLLAGKNFCITTDESLDYSK